MVPLRFGAALLLTWCGAWQTETIVRGLDHVMVAVSNLPEAAERYRALGFTLKPGQPHANGIRNEHVKFADGSELELITAAAAVDDMTRNYRAHLRGGDGPAFAGFFAPDRARLTSRLAALKQPARSSGMIATFAVDGPLGHLFFGSRNRSPTDRPEHFKHANGATSLIGVWVATDDPDTRSLLEGLGVAFETTQVDLPAPTSAQRGRFPGGEVLIVPGSRQTVPGRRIVGVTMRTTSVDLVRGTLSGAAPAFRGLAIARGRSVFLPPSLTHGVWIEMREDGVR